MPETQPKVERILRMREIRTEYHELMKSIEKYKTRKARRDHNELPNRRVPRY